MKTILLSIFCICLIFLNIVEAVSFHNGVHQNSNSTYENFHEINAVYEGTITEIQSFSAITLNGLEEQDWVYLILDTYPDLKFKITLKKGIKLGLFKEVKPFVITGQCKGWYVKLTVNNDMEVTKCRIG